MYGRDEDRLRRARNRRQGSRCPRRAHNFWAPAARLRASMSCPPVLRLGVAFKDEIDALADVPRPRDASALREQADPFVLLGIKVNRRRNSLSLHLWGHSRFSVLLLTKGKGPW